MNVFANYCEVHELTWIVIWKADIMIFLCKRFLEVHSLSAEVVNFVTFWMHTSKEKLNIVHRIPDLLLPEVLRWKSHRNYSVRDVTEIEVNALAFIYITSLLLGYQMP
jgi:hypothetical protein